MELSLLSYIPRPSLIPSSFWLEPEQNIRYYILKQAIFPSIPRPFFPYPSVEIPVKWTPYVGAYLIKSITVLNVKLERCSICNELWELSHNKKCWNCEIIL